MVLSVCDAVYLEKAPSRHVRKKYIKYYAEFSGDQRPNGPFDDMAMRMRSKTITKLLFFIIIGNENCYQFSSVLSFDCARIMQ